MFYNFYPHTDGQADIAAQAAKTTDNRQEKTGLRKLGQNSDECQGGIAQSNKT